MHKRKKIRFFIEGPGASSKPHVVITKSENSVPGKVENFRGFPINPTTIRISWDPPLVGGDSIDHYKLFYAPWTEQMAASAFVLPQDETEIQVLPMIVLFF